MENDHGLEFLDYLVLIVKWKKYLLIITIITLLLSYLAIYFLIRVEYEGSATIVPVEENQLGNLAGLMKGLSSLPLNVGGITKTSQMDIYNTIIFSRTSIDSVIDKFNLMQIYDFPNREIAVKSVGKMIKTDVTIDNAYVVKAYGTTPQMAADITNYIVNLLNRRVIKLNIQKSEDNRLFLEKRYEEIKNDLKNAEDSLKNYQAKSGVFEAEDQIKASIEAYSKLEAELATKQVESSILQKLYGEDVPQVKSALISENVFKSMLDKMKEKGDGNSLILPLKSLPEGALRYFRIYRDVKINESMLEVIIPLYEQAKFNEQKETPILQVVDYAIPPIKKAYPSRMLLSLIITIIVLIVNLVWLVIRENLKNSTNPKVQFIRSHVFNFRNLNK